MMLDRNCTVSVVMPCFNSEEYIGTSVDSVISQTFTDWELLIVDDGSTDRSVKLCRELSMSDARIKVLNHGQGNAGAAVARNYAIEKARGRFIAFLDADDIWLPHKLETQVNWMSDNGLPFTFTAYDKVDESGKFIDHIGVPEQVTYSDLLKCNIIGCLTVIYDTQVLGKVYMPLIRKRQDWGLWLRILRLTELGYGWNAETAKYRVMTNSLSANKGSAASYSWRLLRHVEGLSLINSVYYFGQYVVRGVFRSRFPRLARRLGFLHE